MAKDAAASEWLRGTVQSLLELEINTIRKSNMTAEPAPTLPHALLDIAGLYARALARMGVPVGDCFVGRAGTDEAINSLHPWKELWKNQPGVPEVTTRKSFNEDLLRVDYLTFDRLRWAARAGGILIFERPSVQGAPPDRAARREEGDDVLIERICSNCDSIKVILQKPEAAALSNRPPRPPNGVIIREWLSAQEGPTRSELSENPIPPRAYDGLELEDRIQIRKVWDLGTERVVAQTVVQLTGDVVNRVVPGLTASRDGQILLELHRSGVDTAVAGWHSLLETVLTFSKGILSTFLGRPG